MLLSHPLLAVRRRLDIERKQAASTSRPTHEHLLAHRCQVRIKKARILELGFFRVRWGRSTNTSTPHASTLVGPAAATASKGATSCPKICCTAHIGGPAGFGLEPRAAATMRWALPGSCRIAGARTWLARAISLHAIGTLPPVLGITPALARASRRIQRSPIRTRSYAFASRPVPDLHRGSLADPAVAVFNRLRESLRSLVILIEIYVCQKF